MAPMAPPPAKGDAAADRRKALEAWKLKKAQGASGAGRTSIGGGGAAAAAAPPTKVLNSRTSLGGANARGTSLPAGSLARKGLLGGASALGAAARVSIPPAAEDVANRRRSGATPPSSRSKGNGRGSSGKKNAQVQVVRGELSTPSPSTSAASPDARGKDEDDENTPPQMMTNAAASFSPDRGAMVPSPEAVAAFMASLRAENTVHHSPVPTRPAAAAPAAAAGGSQGFAGFGSVTRATGQSYSTPGISVARGPGGSGSGGGGSPPLPGHSTPASGISIARPYAAAAATMALARSARRPSNLSHESHLPQSPPAAAATAAATATATATATAEAPRVVTERAAEQGDLAVAAAQWRESSDAAVAEAKEGKQRAESKVGQCSLTLSNSQ